MTTLRVSVFLYPLALALAAWRSGLKLSIMPLVMRFSAQLTTPGQYRLMVLALDGL